MNSGWIYISTTFSQPTLSLFPSILALPSSSPILHHLTPYSLSRLDEVFETYDTDQGGTIGITEFRVFLKRHLAEATGRLRDMQRYPAFSTGASPTVRYIPPNTGKIKVCIGSYWSRESHSF